MGAKKAYLLPKGKVSFKKIYPSNGERKKNHDFFSFPLHVINKKLGIYTSCKYKWEKFPLSQEAKLFTNHTPVFFQSQDEVTSFQTTLV